MQSFSGEGSSNVLFGSGNIALKLLGRFGFSREEENS